MKTENVKQQTKRLVLLLGLGGINGTVALAALQGLFTLKNAPMLAIAFMAGPGAVLTAALSDGSTKERMFAALLAGFLATSLVMLSAGFGPRMLSFFNIEIMKIAGAISIGVIALIIAGIKIPENFPLFIMIIGLIASLIWR